MVDITIILLESDKYPYSFPGFWWLGREVASYVIFSSAIKISKKRMGVSRNNFKVSRYVRTFDVSES